VVVGVGELVVVGVGELVPRVRLERLPTRSPAGFIGMPENKVEFTLLSIGKLGAGGFTAVFFGTFARRGGLKATFLFLLWVGVGDHSKSTSSSSLQLFSVAMDLVILTLLSKMSSWPSLRPSLRSPESDILGPGRIARRQGEETAICNFLLHLHCTKAAYNLRGSVSYWVSFRITES
jgi:hypothetical protein